MGRSDEGNNTNVKPSYIAGIDLGGTNIVAGLVKPDGTVLRTLKKPTQSELGSGHVLKTMGEMVKELLDIEGASLDDLLAAGVGLPGFIDPTAGVVRLAGNLGWSDVAVAAPLSAILRTPVYIDNDVRSFTYGEATTGAAAGFEHVLGIMLGTGLASGMVNVGRLYYGSGFTAGEFGHIRMDGVPFACGCGMTGCLETVASATGLVRQVRAQLAAGRESILAGLAGGETSAIRAADVSRAYDLGDALAVEIMDFTGRTLGKALSYAVTLYGPDAIVIGGGASLAGERLLAPMREELKRMVHPLYWERLTIVPAMRLDEAGIVGSAMFALHRLQD
ncbi:ROK family transcriptional regulator [Paenibacillus swuensis]|uniref:ROK family transcriptional regulator n=1 Tax=Paenibacillus swuensis TaxID=1178515 RepID=A0A172TL96_9BACL|nr:ROK family protein [Paenibacillus swuensis]ANE47808.1 ROK family transcriptional regulator [Paenibacillus swuensis]